MTKIAVVSSWNEPCGVASYAAHLCRHLRRAGCDVEVLALPIDLLHEKTRRMVRKGDGAIAAMAARAAEFDRVLLLMEPGLYGGTPRAAYRRMRLILQSAKRAIIAVEGLDRVPPLTIGALYTYLTTTSRTMNDAGWDGFSAWVPASRFWHYVSTAPHVRALTTCADDARLLSLYHNVTAVDHHPVTLYTADEVAAIKTSVNRDDILRHYGLDPARRHVGLFGFVSSYKGHLAAIRSLEFLPDDWELSIIGGEHPRAVRSERTIGSFVRQILYMSASEGTGGRPAGLFEQMARRFDASKVMDKTEFRLFMPHRKLARRIHFLGQPSDDELARLYVAIDYAVHPYIKTLSGQSGSGIAAMALEFGVNALFSNAPVFRQLELYFPGAVPYVNIGNFVELAQALLRYDNFAGEITRRRAEGLKTYNPEALVAKFLTPIAPQSDRQGAA